MGKYTALTSDSRDSNTASGICSGQYSSGTKVLRICLIKVVENRGHTFKDTDLSLLLSTRINGKYKNKGKGLGIYVVSNLFSD